MMEAVIFFIIIMPVLIIKTGYEMFSGHMDEHNLWRYLPHALIIILILAVMTLYLYGYRY